MDFLEGLLQATMTVIDQLNGFFWGWPTIILLVGTGLFLTVYLLGIQVRGFPHALKILTGKYDDETDPGEISHFQALMAALSGTIGTGNIVGVAAAVALGGPGALFWMWMTAVVGMATKFTSCTLAVHFRRVDEHGEAHGGPMYYIEHGLGKKWKWLAMAFAFFTFITTFGGGNMFQINAVTNNINTLVHGVEAEPEVGFRLLVGSVFAVAIGMVIIGGIKSIGRVAAYLVPIMCVMYVAGGMYILVANLGEIPRAFATILRYAFEAPDAVEGGLLGGVISMGVARGLFSNEAGQGSAPIAHGAARTDEPVREGLVAMLGPFIDTIIICSITGLAIVITGAHELPGVSPTEMTSQAYGIGIPGFDYSDDLVSFSIIFFAFSTMITWSYYGNRAIEYLLGRWAILPYQVAFCGFVILGAYRQFDEILAFSDLMNALMAFPNLVALLLLSPLVVKLSRDYFARMQGEGEMRDMHKQNGPA